MLVVLVPWTVGHRDEGHVVLVKKQLDQFGEVGEGKLRQHEIDLIDDRSHRSVWPQRQQAIFCSAGLSI